ncbi:L-threonylcarbamoyladenylate synthase [Candidatus Rariloculus sp.]|uniref:L-threonylcarbamoyladenylate synthase n=1 Tax=Candidatus Rariloculus sp. TaxID=3101265 RepID=UPI003D0C76E7
MSQLLRIHPANPQLRLVRNAADVLRNGGVLIYPTDSCYALGCQLGNKAALERIRRIRRTKRDHDFTLVCRDLSEIAAYARIDNSAYRVLRSLTPGPYTFILRATNEVPKRLQDPKRRSVGIRVPDHAIVASLLETVGEPVMSSTLLLPDDDVPLADPEDIYQRLRDRVDVIIDAGNCGIEPTTVLDLSGGEIEVVRQGKGDIGRFQG